MPYPLSGAVKLDSSGNGTVTLAIPGALTFTRTTISTNQAATATPIPRCDLYRNAVTTGTFLEGTYSGNLDVSDSAHDFDPGEQLLVVWTGGVAGTIASVTLAWIRRGIQ